MRARRFMSQLYRRLATAKTADEPAATDATSGASAKAEKPEKEDPCNEFSPPKKATTEELLQRKAVAVCILGADTAMGEATAFLLKQNPLISHLALYGGSRVIGMSADLAHIDTRCKVHFYQQRGLPNALRSADIVLIMGSDQPDPRMTNAVDLLRHEGPQLCAYAEACSRYAPRAILTVCVSPVASTLPLVVSIFKRSQWYHPGRIIGSAAHSQIVANSVVARYQDLDPASVHVPLIGGPDLDCVVPLFSRAEPVPLGMKDCEMMVARFRRRPEDSNALKPMPIVRYPESTPNSEAFAVNRLVTSIALGLCGDEEAVGTAFVRNNTVPTCKHLVNLVRFGTTRIVHSYGVPKLTKLELDMLQLSVLLLKKRDQEAHEFLSSFDAEQQQQQQQRMERAN